MRMPRLFRVGGQEVIVDEADYELVSQYQWHPRHTPGVVYAYSNTRTFDGVRVGMMHRLIMNPPSGLGVDHINHNGLDNRQSNLRLATQSQNNMNGRLRSDNASGRKGVTWHTRSGKWRAQINRTHLGLYVDIDAASEAYDRAAIERFGEYALTNEALAARTAS